MSHSTLQNLKPVVESLEDHKLALRHSPNIHFDNNEPFLPSAVGYTVFRKSGPSASFPRDIHLPAGVTHVIEYAIWWDYDIQHLYELEHVWVYLDADENLVDAEASWHGGYHRMVDANDQLPYVNGRLAVYSEPGKHAFAPSPKWLLERASTTRVSCGIRAGKMGVHVTPLFWGRIEARKPGNNQLVHTFLEQHAFIPTFEFDKTLELKQITHIPWPDLFNWVPDRVAYLVTELQKHIPLDKRRVLRIAHRGASSYAQENSAQALHMSAELGADMVEVDIRVTADRHALIIHDETLERLFGVERSVANMTLEELQSSHSDDSRPLLTLDDALEICKAVDMGLYLDIKQIGLAEDLLSTVKRHNNLSQVVFASFRPDWLAELKALEPVATTSILFSSTHIDPVPLARSAGCSYIHPCWERFEEPHKLLQGTWLQRVRDAELGVVTWHEERPTEIAALKALGVNAICSNQPDLLWP